MNLVNNDRMTKIISVVLAVVFGVLFVSLVANAVTTISTAITTAGNITTSDGNIEATAGTLLIGSTSVLSGDVTLSGGNGALTLTTTNAATSTIRVGCIAMYATSTDTSVRLTFGTNAWATSTTQGSNAVGLVAWQYGSCPI